MENKLHKLWNLVLINIHFKTSTYRGKWPKGTEKEVEFIGKVFTVSWLLCETKPSLQPVTSIKYLSEHGHQSAKK